MSLLSVDSSMVILAFMQHISWKYYSLCSSIYLWLSAKIEQNTMVVYSNKIESCALKLHEAVGYAG